MIGQAVADELGVPFLDRVIPTAVAKSLAVPVSEALAHDERAETRMARVLAALVAAGGSWGPVPDQTGAAILDEEAFRRQAERVIREAAQTTGGVVLGRAGAIVLRDHPSALHVCLIGSLDARVRQAATRSTDDEPDVRRLIEETDHTRRAYLHHFYRAEPDDPSLYHLMLDSTVLDLRTSRDLIVAAVRARIANT
jgi:cytidylate kinase